MKNDFYMNNKHVMIRDQPFFPVLMLKMRMTLKKDSMIC